MQGCANHSVSAFPARLPRALAACILLLVSASASTSFLARDPDAPGGPTVEPTTPAEAAEITAPLDLLGTVDDDNLAGWRLGYRNVDDDALTRLGEGSTPVVGGVLGHLDPTLPTNDQYQLVLEARDEAGRVSRGCRGWAGP